MRHHQGLRAHQSVAIALLLLAALPSLAQGRLPQVQDRHVASKALGRTTTFRVYLPAGYARSQRRYPVLYLLHGAFGDFKNWDTLTRLRRHAAGLPWIIVMPDAGDSWYTNSATTPGGRFEDYIAHDLISEVDARYRTVAGREGRAIAGLSMGGYGAMKFALRYPQLFSVAGSFSGAFDGPLDLDRRRADLRDALRGAFGPQGSPARAENDVFRLAEQAAPATAPYLYLVS